MSKISYPQGGGFNKDLVSFLPRLDFSCVSKSAIAYLEGGKACGDYPLSGFINSIAEGCSSNGLKLSGGYNPTSEELGRWRKLSDIHLKMHASNVLLPHPAINIAISLRASRSVKEALESLKNLIDRELFLDDSFFDSLTEDVELGGSIMIDLSFGARISRSSVTTPAIPAPSVEAFLLVNDLSATAYVKASSLTMSFPLNLPGEGSLSPVVPLSLKLENGSFNMDLHINLDEPRNITDLFKDGAFNYGGSLDVTFPVELAVDDIDLGVTLKMSDSDIFTPPPSSY